MSGVTSTIHDSGRVYLFDRNALPKNFIESGMKLSMSGLTATVSAGTCDISGKFHELASPASIAIPQRIACLLYAAKSDLTDAPTLGYVQAVFPAADSGTVCRWIIDGSATIVSTVGSNNLTRNGTVTQVDGWIGYGGQGDGSTGYYVSANSTGFPIGAAIREVDIVFTVNSIPTSDKNLISTGTSAASGNQELGFTISSGGNLRLSYNNSGSNDTGYKTESGKTYFMALCYDGANVILKIGSQEVFRQTIALNTGTSVLNLLKWLTASQFSDATIHYVEIRNALRTDAQLATISNALLLPCRYENKASRFYPRHYNMNSPADSFSSTIYNSNYSLLYLYDGLSNTNWCSNHAGTGGIGVDHIGQFVSAKCKQIIYQNGNSNDSYGCTSVKTQWSSDRQTWTDIQTHAVSQAMSAFNTLNLLDYAANGPHYIRIVDNGGHISEWMVANVWYLTDVDFTFFMDIRSILPPNSIVLGFIRTDATKVVEANDAHYKFGRREGAVGGNRRVFLGWQYIGSTITTLLWDSPFDTRKIKLYFVWSSSSSGADETRAIENPAWASGSGGHPVGYSNGKIGFATRSNSAVLARLNDVDKISGYIGCYAEVIE